MSWSFFTRATKVFKRNQQYSWKGFVSKMFHYLHALHFWLTQLSATWIYIHAVKSYCMHVNLKKWWNHLQNAMMKYIVNIRHLHYMLRVRLHICMYVCLCTYISICVSFMSIYRARNIINLSFKHCSETASYNRIVLHHHNPQRS